MLLFEEQLPLDGTWSHVMKRGTALRITDLDGDANVGAVFYNWENPAERYNLPDTLKAQHVARLTRGDVLYSDLGRILCSITGDTVGWHDPLSGCSPAARVSILIELAKYGLGARDMVAPVNFFSKVTVDERGAMAFVAGNSKPGTLVELRAEMAVLVVLNNCRHPLDPHQASRSRTVQLSLRRVPPPAADDVCRVSRPENARGFLLTERYFL